MFPITSQLEQNLVRMFAKIKFYVSRNVFGWEKFKNNDCFRSLTHEDLEGFLKLHSTWPKQFRQLFSEKNNSLRCFQTSCWSFLSPAQNILSQAVKNGFCFDEQSRKIFSRKNNFIKNFQSIWGKFSSFYKYLFRTSCHN